MKVLSDLSSQVKKIIIARNNEKEGLLTMNVTLCKKSSFAKACDFIANHPHTSQVLAAATIGFGTNSPAAGGLTLAVGGMFGIMHDVATGKNPTRNVVASASGLLLFVVSNVMSPRPVG
ncbi:MAG: hypothetical protein EOM37_08325 [Proteobacteria bacterium]|jgi:hypothetical protein|nr:hypothetical protein [Pseudomonadota bacterium]